MLWRRKWQPTPAFLPGESQGRGSLLACRLWGRTESDTTEATYQQQQQQTTLLASWETCMQVKKQQLELDMEQWTGSKLGKEYTKTVYCHPACFTYMQTTSCKTQEWMKQKLESRLSEELSITSDMQMIPPYGRKQRRTKEPLDESEGGKWKSWFKTQHSEN